ncbi:MAG: DUF2807 domain-containing protein [Clostridiales bacterium]|jgi:hypothetical protein|nr:DUF2807 domain-containing protein [Clostridiales bacterium]
MNKKIFMLALALMTGLFVFAGCGEAAVRGRGDMVNRAIPAADFTGINIYGDFELIFRRADTISVNLTMQENLFEYLESEVRGGNLRVRTTQTIRTDAANTPRLYINAPFLDNIVVSGAINAVDWDDIRAENLNIDISGAANVDFYIEAQNINIVVAGAANLVVSGRSDTLSLNAAGAANVEAFALTVHDAVVTLAGAGQVDINATDYLDVRLSGVGTVNYMGRPSVARNITGLGRINRVD